VLRTLKERWEKETGASKESYFKRKKRESPADRLRLGTSQKGSSPMGGRKNRAQIGRGKHTCTDEGSKGRPNHGVGGGLVQGKMRRKTLDCGLE